MKKSIKLISAIIALTFVLLTLAACTQGEITYKTDVKTKDIYDMVSKQFDSGFETFISAPEGQGYSEEIFQGDTHVKYTMRINYEYEENGQTVFVKCGDYFVCTTGGNGCFEYGVFKGDDESGAKAIKSAIENYFSNVLKSEDITSYNPEDIAILDAARIEVYGNYVVYAIAESTEIQNTILQRTKDMLTSAE